MQISFRFNINTYKSTYTHIKLLIWCVISLCAFINFQCIKQCECVTKLTFFQINYVFTAICNLVLKDLKMSKIIKYFLNQIKIGWSTDQYIFILKQQSENVELLELNNFSE